MNRHLVTMLLLIAALAFYAAGFALPAVTLLVIGGALELAVWVRVLRRP